MLIEDEIALTGILRDIGSRDLCDHDPEMNTRGDLLLEFDRAKRVVDVLVHDGRDWCPTSYWPWRGISARATSDEEAARVNFAICVSPDYSQEGEVLALPRVRSDGGYRRLSR